MLYVVTSNDMNEYLQNKTGQDFTCKDFRTLHLICTLLSTSKIYSAFK